MRAAGRPAGSASPAPSRRARALPLDLDARGSARAAPSSTGWTGVWRGTVNRNGVDLRLVLRVATGPLGTIAAFDSPDMMAYGLPVAGLSRDGQDRRPSPSSRRARRFRGTLSGGGDRMTGTWTLPGSPEAEVVFVRGDAAAGAAAAGAAATAAPAFPLSEPRRCGSPIARAPGVTLAGTLTLPPGRGPFPAAILISGSGPQDRDESLLGHKPFAVLADHLTRQGIAVLRYDDRGFGASTGTQAGSDLGRFRDRRQRRLRLPARPPRDRPPRDRLRRP